MPADHVGRKRWLFLHDWEWQHEPVLPRGWRLSRVRLHGCSLEHREFENPWWSRVGIRPSHVEINRINLLIRKHTENKLNEALAIRGFEIRYD